MLDYNRRVGVDRRWGRWDASAVAVSRAVGVLGMLGIGAGAACTAAETPSDTPASTGADSGATTGGDLVTTTHSGDGSGDDTTTGGPELPIPWAPGVVYPSAREPDARGFVDLRGPIHTHSPYSHDACDGEPRDADGVIDAACMDDLRGDLCRVQHDFAFLTDHRDSFSDSEFPEVLLYDPARGDVLVERGGGPVASWAGCDGVDSAVLPELLPTLVMAGCEAEMMPVGLEGHAPGRGSTYGQVTPEAIAEIHAQGGLSLVAHTEDWTPEVLLEQPLDGFEMYNLHANLLSNLAAGAALVALVGDPDALPHSDLTLMPIFAEDPRYLERWGTVLARGGRHVTTMATDAHRNTLPQLLPDGERIDSFRRMLLWFSNHLRVRPEADGTWDDRHVKEALAARRLYGAFEYLGYPEGFDARMEVEGAVREIGDEASLADAPEIVVVRPGVRHLDPEATPPVVQVRILVAREGGFDEVAEGTGQELRYTPVAPGAYRAEVRITPHHLAGYLGSFEDLADEPRLWIYANAFFVTE